MFSKDFGTKTSDGLLHVAVWGCKVTTSNMPFRRKQNVGGSFAYKFEETVCSRVWILALSSDNSDWTLPFWEWDKHSTAPNTVLSCCRFYSWGRCCEKKLSLCRGLVLTLQRGSCLQGPTLVSGNPQTTLGKFRCLGAVPRFEAPNWILQLNLSPAVWTQIVPSASTKPCEEPRPSKPSPFPPWLLVCTHPAVQLRLSW